jgi:hypothetical protein
MKSWCTLCALIIAIVSAVNLVGTVRRVPPPSPLATGATENIVMRHERRLAGVRRAFEARQIHGTIGYVTDLPPDQLAANPAAMEAYFVSQFALVPWVLDARIGECRWAVTNFHGDNAAARVPATFRVVEDFGDGVLLLEKGAP